MIFQQQINSLMVKTWLVFVLTLLPVRSSVAVTTQTPFEQQMARIQEVTNSLAKKSDLAQYEKFATEILSNWRDGTSEQYARLTQALCRPLTAAGMFNDDRQYRIAREFALEALELVDQIPVLVELNLVQNVSLLKAQPKLMTQEEFTKQRLRDAEAWLHALNSFTSTLDPTWDPNEQIPVHPDPPPGLINNYISGASPESIKDPVLRAQYERAVEENKQRIEEHTVQYMLRHRLKDFPQKAERYLINLYSLPPSNPSELKELLNRYNIDETTAERILKAVAAKDKKVAP